MKLARIFIITLSCAIFISILGCGGGDSSKEPNWSITKKGEILEIAYRYENSYPQYAALHLDSSYFRMNYGPGSGWGTSVILFPSFWERGKLYQGAKISSYNTKIEDNILIISFSGTISSLVVSGEIRLLPPEKDLLVAKVKMSINGDIQLDNRPGEAFKTVMLSSMHISDERWDAKTAYVDSQQFSIPKEGWIINPPLRGNIFGLTGGLSQWQIDNNQGPVPTVEIVLDNSMDITGWVTPSENPNDDNVGFWAASNQVIRSWEYTILAKNQ